VAGVLDQRERTAGQFGELLADGVVADPVGGSVHHMDGTAHSLREVLERFDHRQVRIQPCVGGVRQCLSVDVGRP
jgi:hypothetical protein